MYTTERCICVNALYQWFFNYNLFYVKTIYHPDNAFNANERTISLFIYLFKLWNFIRTFCPLFHLKVTNKYMLNWKNIFTFHFEYIKTWVITKYSCIASNNKIILPVLYNVYIRYISYPLNVNQNLHLKPKKIQPIQIILPFDLSFTLKMRRILSGKL